MRPLALWPVWLLSSTQTWAQTNVSNHTLPNIPSNGSALYVPLFEKHSNSTPKFINSTGQTANPLIKALQAKGQGSHKRSILDTNHAHAGSHHGTHRRYHVHHLEQRAGGALPEGTCAPGTPCVNGACCSNKGLCGYTPNECGIGNCISNCNATAPCGQYAKPEDRNCPLNVCCSFFGFCGSTSEFCTSSGERPCQKGYGTCGDAPRPTCGGDSTSQRVVGYYEGWATTRACDKRQPEDIDLTAFTHLNFAFAFFDPTTFQMAPMTAGDETLYRRFTALKSKKPSLKTWIAVGGWSFNDATNVPNTRTAFSDMVASSANRQAFIIGLIQLLTTYNFDGVDLDWEYPTAEDRGGVKADKANFVIFMKELRAALGSRYGISITLPASFWYLRGFDVEALQHHLDWMNVMSYDIHGVWDSGNKHTGPYVRPHTNLTEIEEGLDLLWRAGVEPSKVVLGLGWYGRSFTLANPACNTPNGVCIFSEGGKPGECTQSAGTLTNAEINRIIARGGVTKGFDQKAGVKWISWGLDQWVSYDDGETTQLKVAFANSRCLGGKMIWAVDQDDSQSSSTNDLLGIGPANGVSEEKALEIKQQLNNATQAAAVGNSCYWSFCGSSCTPGWFETTYARGQVAGTLRDTECPADTEQTLCCASGTILGTCKWEGWRGVGLSCAPVCSDSSAIVVARNSNYGDRDCNGGYQAYCCSGFVPSPSKSTSTLNLIGQGGLAKRDNGKNIAAGALICMTAFFMAQMLVSAFTIGMSLVATPLGFSACAGIGAVVGYASPRLIGTVQGWRNAMAHARPRNTGSPDPNQKKKGQWDVLVFTAPPATPGTSSTTCDCYVTYTCRYGKGFDEICDNQRWAITEGFNGASVYHYGPRVLGGRFKKDRWSKEFRTSEFRTFAVQKQGPGKQRYRCEVDEFPMGALREAWHGAHQIVRLVNGKANGAQGNDFSAWKEAVWTPCSIFREHVCSIASPEPPITWAFDGMDSSRVNARTDGSHFIRRYGFDSQTPGSECWATFTYIAQKPIGGPLVISSVVLDHGFRVLPDDPLFTRYKWPDDNDYWAKPQRPYPTEVASVSWLRRRAVESALLNKEPLEYEAPQSCDEHETMVEFEGGLWCMSEQPDLAHESKEQYTPPKITSTATVHPSPTLREHTKAKAKAGPIETASKEGADAVRKYIYGV